MLNTEQKCTGQQTLTAPGGIVVKTRVKAGRWNNGE